jgi:hypothetical protein|tara:strand:+ start:577 stop:831 length:255 start_codon:yes stop_codon:yes gene_type:complete
MLDFLCAFDILISVMRNFEELKEQIQEDIMTWHDGLERNHAYPHLDKVICTHGHAPNAWNDMDKLCDIVIERISEYKNENTISN